MKRRQLERELRALRAPRESAAEQTAWPVVRAAYSSAPPPVARRARRPAVVLAVAAACAAALLALTPAGATVRRWLVGAPGVRHARPVLLSLPAPGTILVSGPGGTWTVDAGGLRHRLGPWRAATWSPHGLYVAGVTANELTTVDRRGTPQWSLARPDVAQPRWLGPTGYRVAYLSGATLRVVAGDGSGDHALARAWRAVAPAWRPSLARYVLAYAGSPHLLVVRDADAGTALWSRRLGGALRQLTWSADGSRLAAITTHGAAVFDAAGHRAAAVVEPALEQGALSPDGRTLALLDGGGVTLATAGGRPRRVFVAAGLRGLAFSPDGHWLLVGWPAADQWVFVRVAGRPRIIAVSRIAEQFGARRALPTIEGWCCVAGGAAS